MNTYHLSINFVKDEAPQPLMYEDNEPTGHTLDASQECRGGVIMKRNEILIPDQCEQRGVSLGCGSITGRSFFGEEEEDADDDAGNEFSSAEDLHLASILAGLGAFARVDTVSPQDSFEDDTSGGMSAPSPASTPSSSSSPQPHTFRNHKRAITQSSGVFQDEAYVDSGSEDEDEEEYIYSPRKRARSSAITGEVVRSLACDKHSKWKKKCPHNCPHRKEIILSPSSSCDLLRRKLWTKNESTQLIKAVHDQNPMHMDNKEGEERWADIAKVLNRTVNSTKKKFMRLTRKWTPRSLSCASSDESSTYEEHCFEEGNGVSECITDQCFDDCIDPDFKRATVVCEKHRRWKKRCPPDCEDKQCNDSWDNMTRKRTTRTPKRKTAHQRSVKKHIASIPAAGRGVGRPAMSCKQHQLEHQKCPGDCPRRPYKRVNLMPSSPHASPSLPSRAPATVHRILSPTPAPEEARSMHRRESRKVLDPCFLYL